MKVLVLFISVYLAPLCAQAIMKPSFDMGPAKSQCLKYFSTSHSASSLAIFQNPSTQQLQTFKSTFDNAELKAMIQEKATHTFEQLRPFLEDPYENSRTLAEIIESQITRTLQTSKEVLLNTPDTANLAERVQNLIDQATKSLTLLSKSQKKIFGLITIGSKSSDQNLEQAAMALLTFEKVSPQEIQHINARETDVNVQTRMTKNMILVLEAELEFFNILSGRIKSAYKSDNQESLFVIGQIQQKSNLIKVNRGLLEAHLIILKGATQTLVQQREHIQQIDAQIPFLRTAYTAQFIIAEKTFSEQQAEVKKQQRELEAQRILEDEILSKQAQEQQNAEAKKIRLAQELEAQFEVDSQFAAEIFKKYEPEVSPETRNILENTLNNPLGIKLNSVITYIKTFKEKDIPLADLIYILYKFPRHEGEFTKESFALWNELISKYKLASINVGDNMATDITVVIFLAAQSPQAIQNPELVRYFRLMLKDVFSNSKEHFHWMNKNADTLVSLRKLYFELIDKVIFAPLKATEIENKLKDAAYEDYVKSIEPEISSATQELITQIQHLDANESMHYLYKYIQEHPNVTLSSADAAALFLHIPKGSEAFKENLETENTWVLGKLLRDNLGAIYNKSTYSTLELEIFIWIASRIEEPQSSDIFPKYATKVLDNASRSYNDNFARFGGYHSDYLDLIQKLIKQVLRTPPGIAIREKRIAKEQAKVKSVEERKPYDAFALPFENQAPAELKNLLRRITTDPSPKGMDLTPLKEYIEKVPADQWTIAHTIYILQNMPINLSSSGPNTYMRALAKAYNMTETSWKEFPTELDIALEVISRRTEAPQDSQLINYLRYKFKYILEEGKTFKVFEFAQAKPDNEYLNYFYKLSEKAIFEPVGVEKLVKHNIVQEAQRLIESQKLQQIQERKLFLDTLEQNSSGELRPFFKTAMDPITRLREIYLFITNQSITFTTPNILYILANIPRGTFYKIPNILNIVFANNKMNVVDDPMLGADYTLALNFAEKIPDTLDPIAAEFLQQQLKDIWTQSPHSKANSFWIETVEKTIERVVKKKQILPSTESSTPELNNPLVHRKSGRVIKY